MKKASTKPLTSLTQACTCAHITQHKKTNKDSRQKLKRVVEGLCLGVLQIVVGLSLGKCSVGAVQKNDI